MIGSMFTEIFKQYICIKQYDETDCGAACLATIAKQHGLSIPITQIREIAGTDRQGTSAYGLIAAAEKLGFTAKGVNAGFQDLFEQFPLPAIAHVVINETLEHYVVVHKISRKKIVIADPGKGLVKYTPEEFSKIWTGVLVILYPAPQFKREKKEKDGIAYFLPIIMAQKGLLLHIFIASVLVSILGMLNAYFFKFLMDEVLALNLKSTLHVITAGFILLGIFKIILGAFRSQLFLYLNQRMEIPLLLGYYRYVIELPLNFFGTRKVGEIISRFQDAQQIKDILVGKTVSVILDTVMAVGGGVVLLVQNRMVFGVAVTMAVVNALIVYLLKNPYAKVYKEKMEASAQLTSYLVESLNGIETIKSFNAEAQANQHTEKQFIKVLKTVFKGGSLSNLAKALNELVSMVGRLAVLWLGAVEVMEGRMSLGQLFTYYYLLDFFLDPIGSLIGLQTGLQTAIVAANRLGEILSLVPEKDEDEQKKITPDAFNGRIQIKGVDFRYGMRELVLKNINLQAEPGEKIALVGESGSGKTTLAKLVMNFYQWEKGEISIDKYNIKDINRERLRDRIAYISQESFLFSATIKENLALGNNSLRFEEVVEAARMAQADEFINDLPLRYNTLLTENGGNLSGGQRQRLAIARAILKKPDILIMDEATSNLDSITEKAIEKTVNEWCKDITTIIIAHRLSTIMRCDKIYVMDKGEIIESGTHRELIRQQGKYYALWQEQVPGYSLSATAATYLPGEVLT